MSRTFHLVCCGILVLGAIPAAQRRVPSATERPTVGVTIALKSGAGGYQATGQGTCT